MATTIKSTRLDFGDIRNNLKKSLAANDEFADYNFEGSGLANLLDVLADNTHYNALIANYALNESYLSTAQLRSSLVSLAEGIGYIPKSRTASTATVTLSVNVGSIANRPSSIQLPSGTEFTGIVDDVSYTFSTRASVTGVDNGNGLYQFKTASGSANIDIKEGKSTTKTFYVSENSVDSVYIIPDANLDINTAVVKVYDTAGSSQYSTYINLVDASTINENTRLYILKEAPNGFYELSFGDGVTFGKAPAAGNKITVEYLSVSGTTPNTAKSFTAKNKVTVNGTQYTVTAVTKVNAGGGAFKESAESIRKNAPFNYAAQNRMVTVSDYSALVLRNYGTLIKDINAFGGQDALKPEFGVVFLSIEFKDDVQADTIATTKNSILDLSKQLSVAGFDVKFEDPTITHIETEVFFQFNPKLTSKTSNTVQDEVQAVVDRYFTNNIGKFAQSFRRSQMLALVDDVDASVLSSRANIKMHQRPKPILTGKQDISLRYPVPLAEADDVNYIITSSSFVYKGDTVVIKNKLKTTKLQVVKLSDNTVVIDNIGSYDPSAGKVNIVGLELDSIIGGEDYIRIIGIPANQSAISPLRNDILKYDNGQSFSSAITVTTT